MTTCMRRRIGLKRSVRLPAPARSEEENEFALQVLVFYEDPLTRRWTRELWNRVHHLIGSGGICRSAWRIGDLARPEVFADAVQAAAKAHVLVISLRDVGSLPARFCDWAEAWVPHRTGDGGALVALIGVHPAPSTASGEAYSYLESVARRAGLDYLPHERKLPDDSTVARQARCSVSAGI
jgi:hypothetical protein